MDIYLCVPEDGKCGITCTRFNTFTEAERYYRANGITDKAVIPVFKIIPKVLHKPLISFKLVEDHFTLVGGELVPLLRHSLTFKLMHRITIQEQNI